MVIRQTALFSVFVFVRYERRRMGKKLYPNQKKNRPEDFNNKPFGNSPRSRKLMKKITFLANSMALMFKSLNANEEKRQMPN